MALLIHDGSFNGLLCALAAAFDTADPPDDILPEDAFQGMLFADEIRVTADDRTASALSDKICKGISKQAFRCLLHAHLSDLPDLGLPCYHYLSAGFRHGAAIDGWHASASVRSVHEAARKTTREIHRLKGLLRFRELSDGTLWAPVEPDHQVILPLALHFKRRLPNECGIIHDLHRGMAVRWMNGQVHYIDPPSISSITLAGDENEVQRLWNTYFRSGTIRERVNPSLQKRCMPVRYWKWLTETPTITDS